MRERRSLGRVVVMNVGYNDVAAGYGDGIDRVMRALEARQVERVVWVTLREQRPSYPAINDAIRAAARRWPELVVADWSTVSSTHDEWFSDGVHMSVEGGESYARFLRPLVLDACGVSCGPTGDLLVVDTTKLVGARVGTPFSARLACARRDRAVSLDGEGTPPTAARDRGWRCQRTAEVVGALPARRRRERRRGGHERGRRDAEDRAALLTAAHRRPVWSSRMTA